MSILLKRTFIQETHDYMMPVLVDIYLPIDLMIILVFMILFIRKSLFLLSKDIKKKRLILDLVVFYMTHLDIRRIQVLVIASLHVMTCKKRFKHSLINRQY